MRELVGLCPFHSEKTPSFEVNDAKGTYHCHGCGAGGDAIQFLVQREGMTFMQAVQLLMGDEFPVVSEEERAKRREADARDRADRIHLARWIWGQSVKPEGTPAEVYARSRGISMPLPPTVRFVTSPRWFNFETGECGREHPAMACALQDVGGAIVGVQCVFLQGDGSKKYERVNPDGSKAKAKLSFGILVGSALRLGPVAPHLVNCEGPEDGLTLAQKLVGQSVWVSCGTALLSRTEYPPEVKSVCFAGDNNPAGRVAVEQARDAALARGLIPTDAYPDAQYKDWNDELRGVTQ